MGTIYKYNKPKGDSSTGGAGSGGNYTVVTTLQSSERADKADRLTNTRLIFGLPFDGTLNVDGDLTTSGSIKADENISGDSVNATKVNADVVEAIDVNADNLNADKGNITELSGTNLSYDNAELKQAIIDALSSTNITTENLTVTKLAHFFELIIDKIKAAGGALLLTPADGFKVDRVMNIGNTYRLFWRSTDGDRAISNMWKAGDLAICLTFNKAEVGTNYNISNKYYWALVVATGSTTITDDNLDYHFIDISKTDSDGTLNPEVGDEIAMLGYRGTDDKDRLSAIYLAAYNSLDPTLKAPLICHYKGINDYDLKNHKYTFFAANGSEIRGNLKVESGLGIDDYIKDNIGDITNGKNAYLHTAYSNSADGLKDFTKAGDIDGKSYSFIGLCSNHTERDDMLIYSDYLWSLIKGNDGKDADYYKLIPIREFALVGINDILALDLCYKPVHIVGNTTTLILLSDMGFNLQFRTFPNTNSTIFEYSNNPPVYSNPNYIKDYSKEDNKILYLIIELTELRSINGRYLDFVVDTRIVLVTLDAGATFEITNLIKTSVQDSYNELSKDIQINRTNISTLIQRADNITSTILLQSVTINNLTGEVDSNTLNISTLLQTANGLKSTVESHTETLGEHTDKISEIEQTADNIRMLVDNISLQITDKKIILDGDTEIRGDLTMDNSTLGLILAGNGGTTLIKPTTIGSYQEFSSKSYLTIRKEANGSKTANATAAYVFTDFEHLIGYIKSGIYLQLNGLTYNSTRGDKAAPVVSVTFLLFKDGVLCSGNASVTINTPSTGNFFTYTTSAAGNYSIKIRVVNQFDNSTAYSSNTVDTNVAYNIVLPTEALTILGYDGYASNFGNNKAVYFGSEQTVISYGDAKLRFSTNGIEKYAGTTGARRMNNGIYTDSAISNYPSEWVALNGSVVRKITTAGEVYLLQNDEFIVVTATSGTVNINLLNAKNFDSIGVPNKNMVGRKIYIKNMGACTMIINGYSGSEKNLVNPGDGALLESYNPLGRAMMVMSDGLYWHLYYCG